MKRRASVGAYLLVAFAACLAGVAGLAAFDSHAAFTRERSHATGDLASAAQLNVAAWDSSSVTDFLTSMVGAPGIAAGDTAACNAAMSGLASVTKTAHLHVVAGDGAEVCSLRGDFVKPGPLAVGDWLQRALSTDELVSDAPAIDPLTGEPSYLTAQKVGDGRVMAIVLLSGRPPNDAPRGASKRLMVLTLDTARTLVLSTTPHSPIALGANPRDYGLDVAIPKGGASRRGPDGSTWLWQEAKSPDGWPIVAGIPAATALATARHQLRQELTIGTATLLLVALVAFTVHRRLTRPVRALRAAIDASRSGDLEARAPVGGPIEVAELATAYNEMVDWREGLEEHLRYRARHDVLTDLPNRLYITELLDEALAAPGGHDRVAVLFLDLDQFKLINDSYGHGVGDQMLQALGRRLLVAVGEDATVGRFGGDEFVLVATAITGETEARELAATVGGTLRWPFELVGQQLYLNGSVGIALAEPGDTAEDMIRNADTAMYRAKDAGRGGSAMYDSEMRAWSVGRLTTERELHLALERDEFTLHYQPVMSVATGRPVSYEALIRWNHPTQGLVMPNNFISVAEDTGLIVPMGRWVLEEACRQAAAWRAEGAPMPIAVNVAARQLARSDLVDDVEAVLRLAGAVPADLIVEITESAVLANTSQAIDTLEVLRLMGIRVAVDDFGTGYSSLSYLQRLPIDEVKIDHSFISRLGRDEPSDAIVSSIIQLAHALDLTVVAEGVERRDQLAVIRKLGCDSAQGFLLGRPAPAPSANSYVRRGA
jgi:diguanylate cyclase (GGDEF)-like protein